MHSKHAAMSPALVLASTIALGILFQLSSAAFVTISNVVPRVDSFGVVMDAHDGTIVQWSPRGPYYWYAMGYGLCKEADKGCGGKGGSPSCGFHTNHSIGVWRSPDLNVWTWVGEALPVEQRPVGIYYRPRVIYNSNTAKFVLWVNLVPGGGQFGASRYVVATSSSPVGPFKVEADGAKGFLHQSPGDFNILVDDDANATAYIIYTAVNEGHNMSVEKLAPDYLSSTGMSSGFFGQSFVEAPAAFKRNGRYYFMFGHCCCFCVEGSGAGTYTSTRPLGPFQSLGDPGCDASKTDPGPYGCAVDHKASITHSQQDTVVAVATTSGTQLLWKGDRWQSSPDGIKAHDFSYFAPLEFDDTKNPPTIKEFYWIENFTLSMPSEQSSPQLL